MPFEQQPRDLGQPRLGVAHGGGVIAVDIAEIALPLDERVALREILRHAHQRVVDRLVAMRMVLTHHVADDAGAFLRRRFRIEPQQPHGMQDAPVNRLQPVARIRQRPVHDGRQRIGEIALFQRILEIDVLDLAARGWSDHLTHEVASS